MVSNLILKSTVLLWLISLYIKKDVICVCVCVWVSEMNFYALCVCEMNLMLVCVMFLYQDKGIYKKKQLFMQPNIVMI